MNNESSCCNEHKHFKIQNKIWIISANGKPAKSQGRKAKWYKVPLHYDRLD